MSAAGGRRSERLLMPAALAICACWLLYSSNDVRAAEARKPAAHIILIDGVMYVPETLTVKLGDTVVWLNKDPFPHTVTAKGSFDSHAIATGKSWKWTPRKTGNYAYLCTLHPNMTGTVKVE